MPSLRQAQWAVTEQRIIEALTALIDEEHPLEISMATVAKRGQLLQGHVPIMALGPAWDAMSYQIRSLVSDPDDTDADLPGPGAAPSGSRAAW